MAQPASSYPKGGLRDPIEDFLTFLSVEKSASGNTVAAYRSDLTQLASFVESRPHGNCWQSVSRITIGDFVVDLRARGYTETSVARKMAAARSFFAFLIAEGTLYTNPTEGLPYPRVGKALPRAISPGEVAELLMQPGRRSTPEARRDRAMLELLYATGMRVTELVSLDLDDLILDPRNPRVHCKGGKSKERTIPIHGKAAEALADYLGRSRPLLLRGKSERALFVNRRGERTTRQGFWLIVKGYARSTSLGGDITPHILRHTFAAHMLHSGMDLSQVQKMLGHAALSTTRVYTRSRAN